jgi:diaminohydroxyphosphoribosylaminopyrimidine deaminase / 5-amino-6-(5-phosphoribosylamino)uracil reductase
MMDAALALAWSGLGTTAPNPSVGCILVKNGKIIGKGRTANGGRPHAEREALDAALEDPRAATAYVTLEPCAHTGLTPPCADALIEAGINRVVIGCVDPDERTSGAGIARLKAAGISVETGVREKEAGRLNAGFFHRIGRGWPLVVVDANPASYDKSIHAFESNDVLGSLRALGADGVNRLRILPDSPAAEAAAAANLIDEVASGLNTPR